MKGKDLPGRGAQASSDAGRDSVTDFAKALKESGAAIAKLRAELKEKELHVNFLKFENRRLTTELYQIRMSLTWKLLMNFHNSIIETLIPRGTKRRTWYDKTLDGLVKYVNKGDKIFATSETAYDLDTDENELEAQRQTRFPYEPKISIIVPTFNTRDDFLTDMIESVKKQTYTNWELCIADGGSKDAGVKSALETYAAGDPRIRVKLLRENRGISGNSNEAVSLATGDFMALLDHDDTLTPSAMFEVVKAINENPRVDFVYSDYAITDEDNRIRETAFCPDFCRHYYLSHPYIVHLVVIRKDVMDKVGGFDEKEFNVGVSHDVDLFLRIFALSEDEKIVHIPKILYLWRQYQKSAGHRFQHRVHTYTKMAIRRYLQAKRLDGEVEDGLCFNTFRVRIRIQDDPLVSIIIPTKDKWQLLRKCLKSIEAKSGYKRYEIIIIKNNTENAEASKYLRSLRGKYRIEEYNNLFNYSAINNYGKQFARGDFLLFLNDDIEFKTDDTIRSAVEILQLPEIGAVGAKLLYPDRTIQHAGVILGLRGPAEHWHKFVYAYMGKSHPEPGYLSSLVSIREFSAVTGAFLMTKKSVFEEVGGFSEDLKVGFNDIDFCLKIISRGHRILYTPYAVAFHYESASRRDPSNRDLLDHPEDGELFLKKWAARLEAGDPCYNPNLSTISYIPIPAIRER